ncbi:helix-turn-helix domain-containing protein [Micromonospora sp. NPDC005203]|uniref:helix-turn-helix domain-containing protein n=1 Tax=Micromonospora sp. NPDC005203 TaxID=3364226 RepID=UPI0036A416D4
MADQQPTPGQRVERLRRAAGLSREQLAGLAGLSPTTIKFVENGPRSLTLRAAQQVAPQRLREARDLIEPRVADGGNEWAEMLADLHLCTALTRARTGDQGAWSDWDAARRVVEQALPTGFVGLRTRVSRPLVDVYAVMCAVDLGDPDEAQRRAHSLDPALIPSTERRGRHYVELARSADLERTQEATLHLVGLAESTSPETVRYSPAAQELAGRLAREAPASIRAEAIQLESRIAVPEL